MKAIVVIFVRTRDVKLPAGQSLAISISASLQGVAVVGADKTNRADKSTIHNESAPPFWTWFIENPRPIIQDLSVALRI
jgi:hypothetical protein